MQPLTICGPKGQNTPTSQRSSSMFTKMPLPGIEPIRGPKGPNASTPQHWGLQSLFSPNNQSIWGSKTMAPPPSDIRALQNSGLGISNWSPQSQFPPKTQPIWGSKFGPSVPERSERQFRLHFGRFGGRFLGQRSGRRLEFGRFGGPKR